MWTDSKPVFFILSGAVFLFVLLLLSMLWGVFGQDTFKAHTVLPAVHPQDNKNP
ncbi:hypothetical protein ACSYAY_03300 [Leptospirillum ferriphilum]|jgi:hypothetical protein|nr:hypothetical protein [Leptospirillum ferriphilum]MCL5259434.1 hypothetical protein [Nitrospirota bacterium]